MAVQKTLTETVFEDASETSDRQSAGSTIESDLTTLLADVDTYLAAGSGQDKYAKAVVGARIAWVLESNGILNFYNVGGKQSLDSIRVRKDSSRVVDDYFMGDGPA